MINVKSMTGWSLYWEVVTGQMQSLYDVLLCHLTSNELNLDQGRFTKFDRTPQTNDIQLGLPFSDDNFNLPTQMNNWIEWLAEHSRDCWNVELRMYSLGSGDIRFSFADVKDAIFFRLVFG